MFCTRCGKELNYESRFCVDCAREIAREATLAKAKADGLPVDDTKALSERGDCEATCDICESSTHNCDSGLSASVAPSDELESETRPASEISGIDGNNTAEASGTSNDTAIACLDDPIVVTSSSTAVSGSAVSGLWKGILAVLAAGFAYLLLHITVNLSLIMTLMGLIMTVASIGNGIGAIILGVSCIKTFKRASAAKGKLPVATLVLGIIGIAYSAITLLLTLLCLFIILFIFAAFGAFS